MSEYGDNAIITGSVQISGSFDIVGSATSHDLASGLSIVQNSRAGSTTITNNGTWTTDASLYFRLYSDEIKNTDVVSVSTNRSILVMTVVSAGMVIINLTNKGASIANDSETIVNWAVL